VNSIDRLGPAPLDRLCAIAREAGAEVMRHYGSDVECRQKADASPVTAADVAAEGIIVSALQAWQAAIAIVSEESALPELSERRTWERYWLVDPLDGTKEFLAGNGEFTVNIALVEGDRPVLGVVLAPAFDLVYCAGCGLGAWRQAGRARPRPISSRAWQQGDPARIVESRSHPSRELEDYLTSIRVVERIRLGSSLKFCRVAEGSADLYPRFGPTMAWDVAAGDCVYRHSAPAGERLSPIAYDVVSLRVPGFVLGRESVAPAAIGA
jgi:3'(2'), 5'-bisphosphate nucleotidase